MRCAIAVGLLVLGVVTAQAEVEPGRVFILDVGSPALVSVDLASGKRVASLPLVGAPSWLVQTDDGRYIVLLDHGPGEDKGNRGYKATGRSSATIVDARSFTVIGRVELGFGLDAVLTRADGRLTVTSAGYDAKEPREALARELIVVDLATARETGRLQLEPGTDLTWRSRDGRTLALLQGLPRSKKYPYPNARITIVDVGSASVTATLDSGGWDQVERDAEHLYLIVFGRPHKDPQKNVNGWIDVISFADRRVDRLDIGRSPMAGLAREDGLFAVVSEGPAGGAAGELRFLRDGKLAVQLPVAARPMWLGEVGDALYVVGGKAVTIVDPDTLRVSASIPLERGGQAVVDDDDRPFELVATSDGRRAFIHYPAQDKVAVLDLEQQRAIGSTKTGRGGKKFLNNMASFMTSGLYAPVYFYNSSDPPQMLVRSDGRFAYALNLDTSDVTVVDADTAGAVEKIGAGGHSLLLLGSRLVVVGPQLHFIDTSRNAKVGELALPGLAGPRLSPDSAFLVALAKRTVLILDGATGEELARLTDFVQPARLAFARTVQPAAAPAR